MGVRPIGDTITKWLKRLIYLPIILAIIGLLSVAITDRYLLDGELGFVWVEELCVILMIWLIFMSVFIVDRENLHLRVTLFEVKSKWAEWLEDLCLVSFAIILGWTTYGNLPFMFSKYAALGWSIKVGYYAIMVGTAMAVFAKVAKYAARAFGR
ncbi:MAG: TRAP transporter small permease subunit [Chromatiales bacterium]|nr:TRAP transporter small permease subunit [Chromatiales bacterium]